MRQNVTLYVAFRQWRCSETGRGEGGCVLVPWGPPSAATAQAWSQHLCWASFLLSCPLWSSAVIRSLEFRMETRYHWRKSWAPALRTGSVHLHQLTSRDGVQKTPKLWVCPHLVEAHTEQAPRHRGLFFYPVYFPRGLAQCCTRGNI